MAIITISRGTYSGGRELAECLSKQLGYKMLSREELLTDASKEYGVSAEELEHALMNKPGFLEGVSLKRIHYVAFMTATLCREVQNDNVVYHGQAGHLLLKGIPHHMRLKIVADMEYRIKAAMERGNFTSREKAIDFIKRMHDARDKWVRSVYGVERNDLLAYDMVINLEHISMGSACDIVAETVKRDFKTTPEGHKIMADRILASEVRARIGTIKNISDDHIEVEASDGIITLTGTIRSSSDADKVREFVRSLPGVKGIESKMGAHYW